MDAQLVDMIVRQVVAALQRQGLAASGAAVATDAAACPAPSGACAASSGAALPAAAAPAGAERPAPRVTVSWAGNLTLDKPFVTGPSANQSKPLPAAPRKVFITAEMLAQRLAIDGASGSLELAPNEFLTPGAQDLVERRRVTIHQAAPTLPIAAEAPPAAAAPSAATATASAVPAPVGTAVPPGAALGVVVERPDTKVQMLLTALQQERPGLLSYNQTDCWIRNLRALGAAIAAGSVWGGLAILPYGADAMLLAGKLPGVRAVQGTGTAGVAAAVRHFGANLLVLEHAFSTLHQLRAMIRQFAAPRAAPAAQTLMKAVAELEGR